MFSTLFHTRSSALAMWALLSMHALAGSYRIVQITFDSADHRWPSINNSGDIVWSQKVGTRWQVYRRNAPLLSNNGANPVSPPDSINHNYKYPSISDGGELLYLRDNNPRNNGGSDLQVVRNRSGVETVIEFSNRNSLSGDHRDAGPHFGMASDATIISYFTFIRPLPSPTQIPIARRLSISGNQIQDATGARNFTAADYPSINADRVFVYSTPAGIYKETYQTNGTSTGLGRVDLPGENASAPSIADGPNSEIVYISNPQVVSGDITSGTVISSKLGGAVTVRKGSWARVNKDGVIVIEDTDSAGNRQIFLALPLVHLLDPTLDLMNDDSSDLTHDVDVLSAKGHEVDGVASDGVTRLVVRIPATGFDRADLTLSSDSSVNGTLINRPNGTETSTLTVNPEANTAGQTYFFAFYRAPARFVDNDSSVASRDVLLSVRLSGSSGTADLSVPIKIVRPPVLLVQGLWARADVWNAFGELSNISPSAKFFTNRATISGVEDFQSAAAMLYRDLISTIKSFKNQRRVAAIQVNVVANGTGAPIVETAALPGASRTAGIPSFLNDPGNPTFGGGPINKMISIGGAHLGSDMASYLIDNPCIGNVLSNSLMARLLWFQPTPMNAGGLTDSAFGSASITQVTQPGLKTPFPVHTIIGQVDFASLSQAENLINGLRRMFCSDSNAFTFSEVLGTYHDLFVSSVSQLGFRVGGLASEIATPSVIQKPPYASNFGALSELAEPAIAQRVVVLLDSVNSQDFAPLEGASCSSSPVSLATATTSNRVAVRQENSAANLRRRIEFGTPVRSITKDSFGNYYEKVVLEGRIVYGGTSGTCPLLDTSYQGSITFRELGSTGYYQGLLGTTMLPSQPIPISGGIAKVELLSLSDAQASINATTGRIEFSRPVQSLIAASSPGLISVTTSVEQWFDEDKNQKTDWFERRIQDVLRAAIDQGGELAAVANKVQAFTERSLNQPCGADSDDLLSMSPVCNTIQLSRTDERATTANIFRIGKELGIAVLHEARHAWQTIQANGVTDVDSDRLINQQAAYPTPGYGDRNYIEEASSFGGSHLDSVSDSSVRVTCSNLASPVYQFVSKCSHEYDARAFATKYRNAGWLP